MLFISRALRQAPEEHATLSAKMETIASKLIDKMNEIIWAMSHENDSLADLVAYIRVQADDMKWNSVVVATFVMQAANRAERFPRKPAPGTAARTTSQD